MLYAVHGVADRDPDELVLMFFDKVKEVEEFVRDLPGKYETLVVGGLNHEDIQWVTSLYDKQCIICEQGIRIGEDAHTDEETGEDCHARCCPTCNGGGV